ALENVCLPTMIQKSWFSYQRRETEERAKSLLDRVGLSSRMKHRSGQLSGGERQRVAIARALMNTPQLLLCDEPTGNLDQKTAEGVLELIWSLASETKTTFVIVTHAKELGKRADRFIEVIDGKIVATG
ncbi:MAG: ABC transporter ATP-binding protein, partial [Planctomycetota bacterium]